jgi:hypothetical protein
MAEPLPWPVWGGQNHPMGGGRTTPQGPKLILNFLFVIFFYLSMGGGTIIGGGSGHSGPAKEVAGHSHGCQGGWQPPFFFSIFFNIIIF